MICMTGGEGDGDDITSGAMGRARGVGGLRRQAGGDLPAGLAPGCRARTGGAYEQMRARHAYIYIFVSRREQTPTNEWAVVLNQCLWCCATIIFLPLGLAQTRCGELPGCSV